MLAAALNRSRRTHRHNVLAWYGAAQAITFANAHFQVTAFLRRNQRKILEMAAGSGSSDRFEAVCNGLRRYIDQEASTSDERQIKTCIVRNAEGNIQNCHAVRCSASYPALRVLCLVRRRELFTLEGV